MVWHSRTADRHCLTHSAPILFRLWSVGYTWLHCCRIRMGPQVHG
jgi:hypothetical protein